MPKVLAFRQGYGFAFEWCLFRNFGRIIGCTDYYSPHDLTQSLHIRAVILPWLFHEGFFKNPFKIVIRNSSYNSML
jgi:hypothetical protein